MSRARVTRGTAVARRHCSRVRLVRESPAHPRRGSNRVRRARILLIPSAIQRIVQGDPAAGDALFSQAAEIARRYGNRDLACKAVQGRGRALIRLGRVREGVALLDEAMVAVIAGDVSPMLAGDAYCTVLEGCQEIFDLRRAYEWTTSLARWCAEQPDLVRYRGECLLYRAEVLQLRGKWDEAARDAQDACELLMSRPAAGAAFYRLGEIHRLRGEFEKAEAAYMQANERGRKPQPGLSLLRLPRARSMPPRRQSGAFCSTRGHRRPGHECSPRPSNPAGRRRSRTRARGRHRAVDDRKRHRGLAAERGVCPGHRRSPPRGRRH